MALLLHHCNKIITLIKMKKIKQSFVEVVAGQPRKEHYIKVSIVVLLVAVVIGALLIAINKG